MTWWLVGLALGAGAVGVWRARRHRDRSRCLMLLARRAHLEYSPLDPFSDTLWLPFRWLGEGRWARSEHVVWNRAEGEDMRVFDLAIEEPPGRDGVRGPARRYTCATASLPLGCPRLEIMSRDAVDAFDAFDAFGGSDIELELESFNRRFRLRSADRRFAVRSAISG